MTFSSGCKFHSLASHAFARPDSWGLVKDKKEVAGFQPHHLEFVPEYWARQRYDEKNPFKNKDGVVTGYRERDHESGSSG